jgi:two-component sensor histidine kinase/HAMP domain-containing protein
MPLSISKNISQRFIFWLAIIIPSTLFVFFAAFIGYDARSTETALNEQADHILSFSKQSLASAMWQYNHEYVKDYIESLFLYRDIVFAQGTIESQIIKTKTRDGYKQIDFVRNFNANKFIIRKSPVEYKKDDVGSIIFVMNTGRVAQQVIRNSLAAGLLLLFVATIISLTMIILFRKNVMTPLVNLDNSARQIASGEFDTPIDISSQDEIGQLAKSFSHMMQNIRSITASRDELNNEIAERKRAEKIITENLKEKEVLLKEVHHRVKNNMQMIQSLISLQADKIKNEKHKQPLIESNNRIRVMALVHESLYKSENLSAIDLNRYFNELIAKIMRIYENPETVIDLSVHAAPLVLDIDKIMACGLIANELVTNSLKYAFGGRKKGRIAITLKKVDAHLAEFIVRDDGPGLPRGFDPKSTDSLGLRMVWILAENQLDGEIDVRQNQGLAYFVKFSI